VEDNSDLFGHPRLEETMRRAVFAVCGLFALSFAGAAFAQQAMMVFGGGYARDCYHAVKDREPALKALGVCNTAIGEEDLSRINLASTLVNRGIVYMREENYDRAMRDYDRALKLMPDMPEIKINLGAMLYHMGQFREAVDALNAGVKAENTDARAAGFYNRALAYERLGEVQLAYDDYRAALAVIPGYPPAERQLRRFSVLPAGQAGS
jgi:tetratricopeptide (TPR) repeat protein